MIAVGAVYEAAWGSYAVHRMEGDEVVLRDRAGAFVVTTRQELAGASRYQPAPTASPTSFEPSSRKPGTARPRTTCDDCGRSCSTLWHHGDPDDPTTLRFCGPCLRLDRPPTRVVLPASTWQPAPGAPLASRAEIAADGWERGTAPAAPRPSKPTRESTQETWGAATRAVAR